MISSFLYLKGSKMRKWNHLCLTAKTWKIYQSLQAFLNRYLIYSEVLSFLGTNGTSIDNALRGSLGGPDSPTSNSDSLSKSSSSLLAKMKEKKNTLKKSLSNVSNGK